MKREATEWEKILRNILKKTLESKMCKEYLKLNNKKENNSIFKRGGEAQPDTSPKRK